MDHFQSLLKAIGNEWNRLVPNGTMEIETDPLSGFIEDIYLSLHAHDGVTNMYPHIHIFLEKRKKTHNYYGFTVSCTSDLHFLNKPMSASISPTEYCAYFQSLLKTHCQLDQGISLEEYYKMKRANQKASWVTHYVMALVLVLVLVLILLFVHLKIRSIPVITLVFHKFRMIYKKYGQ